MNQESVIVHDTGAWEGSMSPYWWLYAMQINRTAWLAPVKRPSFLPHKTTIIIHAKSPITSYFLFSDAFKMKASIMGEDDYNVMVMTHEAALSICNI